MNSKKIFFFLALILVAFCAYHFFNQKTENDLETVKIKISKPDFEKIKTKRKEALDLGILLTSKLDYVPAGFQIDTQFVKSKIRLKGDWVDHLEHKKKWSFRVKIGKGGTYHGMRKFSLQHPITRNYIYEWVFHKMQKEMGIISLRYEFVNLVLDIDGKEKDLGIYVLEEAFDKRLIENNERRTGLILKFDETELWEDRANARINETEEKSFEEIYQNAPIASFNKKTIRKDSTLSMQFRTASNLLAKYRKKELPSHLVFDLDKMGKFLALVNLLGGEHAVIWHNVRYYYNPITSLLEPIGFDAIGGIKYDYVIKNHVMGSDSNFIPFHNKHLQTVTSDSFLTEFKNKYQEEMNQILKTLNSEFDDIIFDESILQHNQNTIKKYLEEIQASSKKTSKPSSLISLEEPIKMASNLQDFNFIIIDSLEKKITFQKGNWTLNKSLIIPKGFKVYAEQGFNLDIINGAEIISSSPFYFTGTKSEPIKISSSLKNGDGLFIKDCREKSVFEYVDFIDLSNPKSDHWSLTGAATFYQSDVDLSYVNFIDNRSEDAVNIFSASFTMNYCNFINTASDAFDGDFVLGTLNNCNFENLGNDAIDISGSKINIENIFISSASDKCISAGERSEINGKNLVLSHSELAITSKDLSTITLSDLTIDSCKVGFTAFQKKSEYDRAIINVTNTSVSNAELLHLIEVNSILTMNGELMPNTINVKDRLYGKEFGKSSK